MKLFKILIGIFMFFTVRANAQSISGLPPGVDPSPWVLFYDDDDSLLYAGGNFDFFTGGIPANRISKWNGNGWDTLTSGVNDGGTIRDIVSFKDTIFVAGTYSEIGGIVSKGLAKWDGNFWNYVGDFTTNQGYGSVFSLETHNGSLYIGGGFTSLNGLPVNGLVRYDGVSFFTYPILDPGSPTITSICFYNGELYVGGNFNPGGGKNDIAKWDGNSWVSVGGGFSGGNTVVDDMVVYNGELYVSGHFLTLYGDPGNLIAKWDGTNWNSVGLGLDGGNCYDMEIFNNELYVGGSLFSAGGTPVNNIAKWDGNIWHNIGANFSHAVTCLETKDSSTLIIGGGFLAVNGDTVNRICEYNLLTGVNEISNEKNFHISPNPTSNSIEINLAHGSIDEIEIFDLSGKLVLEQQGDESLSCQLDVSSLANGIYVIKVFSEYGIYSEKLIIQKME